MSEKTIGDAFNYPLKQWTRLFNFWWVIIPILGWFAIVGYWKKIIVQMLKKDFKELPKFGGLIENFKEGFIFFLVMLVPLIIGGVATGLVEKILSGIPFGGIVSLVFWILVEIVLAILFINYVKKNEFEAVFDIKKAWKIISKDWGKTIMALVYQLIIVVIFLLLSVFIITWIVFIPAAMFVSYYFFVDLYNRQA